MLSEVKAVIFDLDGTLIDSMWIWSSIDVEYLERFGLELPPNLQNTINGMGFTEIAKYFKKEFGITDSVETIKEDWNQMAWDKYSSDVQLKNGSLKLLEYLKKNNIKIGIATSNFRPLVELVIRNHNIKSYFESIRTSCDVDRGKPSPDIYLKVASDMGVKPEDCLVFEDVISGIMAGKNANMKVCAVHDNYSMDSDEEKSELADYFIHSFEEVLEKIGD